MPLWKPFSAKNKQQLQQEQTEAEASRQSLEAGGLPLKAIQRLMEEKEAGHPLFTSDLSTSELLLTRQQGYQPLSQVMGSSIYHVGKQYPTYYGNGKNYNWDPVMEELPTLSEAHRNAARLAFGRLKQEAALLGAHGVIGVRFTRRSYEWGPGSLEYTAIGTAVKLPYMKPPTSPFLSDLSGQAFWKLLQAGYYPAGIVTGYCSYHVALGAKLGPQISSIWESGINNQEIAPFARGISTARQIAIRRATKMARDVSARGIVGMQIEIERDFTEYEFEFNEKQFKSLNLTIHFVVTGTAIRVANKAQSMPTPRLTLALTDLRPGQYGQNRELTFNE